MKILSWSSFVFQSTPGFKAGRYAGSLARFAWALGFNPLPALRPGDTKAQTCKPGQGKVSIHSRL